MKTQNPDGLMSPLVSSIVSTLEERIFAGRYTDQDVFPSERELVEEFDVSRTLIRRVLETLGSRGLVIRSPRCRTVIPRQVGTAPLRKETKRRSVGLWLWPNPTDPGTSCVARGVCAALDQSAYRLVMGQVVCDTWEAVRASEACFLEHMAEDEDIVGVLLWYLSGTVNLPALHRLRAAGIPMVFMDRMPPPGFEADYVGIDNEYAAEQIVSHLIAQGHRRIAHITNGDSASTVAERMHGYQSALRKAGLPCQPELIVAALEASSAEAPGVYNALADQLLSLSDPPTAVFAVNDVTAERFLAALRGRGVHVPDEIALAGFDGLERWSAAEPFLTTVEQPFDLLGMNAAKLLSYRIEHGASTAYRHVLLEASLGIYGSTRVARRMCDTSR